MAPNGEASVAVASMAPLLTTIIGNLGSAWQRTPSWPELHGNTDGHKEMELLPSVDSITEVEEAECECCGMSEECTPAYISKVRRRFSGQWVCGLCAEAVAEEAGKRGCRLEEALVAHMGVCRRFNGFGRTHPALFQADAMKGILKKLSGLGSPKSNSRREAMAEKAAPPAA
ncbi:uncharacterized protein [Lolium perenne]|uniref:uncharacterized protein n=1 Tax=Lolium perenne TaxID=4522 RepID=UPI0021EA5243|nr:uncharacterized protein LOC127307853 [Lolium perenne]